MNAEVGALLAATAAAFIALVFVRAAWHKLNDFAAFTGFVADYELLPPPLVRPASAALTATEMAVPVAMLVPGGQPVGAVLAAGLLGLYAAAMGVNILRGRTRIECGCGGAPSLLSPLLLVRNAVLAGIAAVPLAVGGGPLSFGDAAAAVLLGFLLWAFFLLSEQVLANGIRARLIR
jgi:hypothetical protein